MIDVTTLGIVPDGRDVSALMRTTFAVPGTYYLPSGRYNAPTPVTYAANSVVIQGAGIDETTINGPGLWPGKRETEFGVNIADSYRPPVDNVLDATCSGRFGYRTCGKSCITFDAHPFALGAPSPLDAGTFDEYGDTPALSIYLAIGPGITGVLPDDAALVGLGSWQDVRPWQIRTQPDGSDAGTCNLLFLYRLAGDDESINAPARAAWCKISKTGLSHVWITFDDNEGTISFSVNRKIREGFGQTFLPSGARLMRNRGRYPLTINCDGWQPPASTVPGWILYGLRTSSLPVPTSPLTDYQAYYDPTQPGTLCLYEGAKTTPTRLISTLDGNGTRRWGWLNTTFGSTGWEGAVKGNAIRDLTIDGGGLGIGDCLGLKVERCRFWGQMAGIASIARGGIYPLTIRDCEVASDHDAALSLRMVKSLRIEGLDIQHFGTCAARFSGCEGSWRGGFAAYYSSAARWGIQSLSLGYGLSLGLSDLYYDNEGGGYLDGLVYAEEQPYGATYLSLERVRANQVTSGTPFLRLKGFPGDVYSPSAYRVSGCGNENGNVTINADPQWTAS